MLRDGADAFSPQLTNKKQAAKNAAIARNLRLSGYQFPSHWKNAGKQRPFVAWDGEGITYKGDVVQSYVLFGASTGDRIVSSSLSTRECFDLLLAVEQANPDAIHVGFATQYDCNMMFRDLPRRHLERIYRSNVCNWEGYRIEYRPTKWLSLRKGSIKVRLFDVFGFFQSSFLEACKKFLGKNDPELARIETGKQARKAFEFDQLHGFIIPYWEAELRLLVRLMDSLRDDLDSADIHISSWHGPGAVANAVLRSHGVKNAKAETPKEVHRASQYAYAGGRFELFRAGHYPHPVWEYDINSAYPTAIARLPNLSNGAWRYASTFEAGSFGVWRVNYLSGSNPKRQFLDPQPIFCRDEHANVSYPPLVEGWYWTPEAQAVAESVQDGWVFDHDGTLPFKFVEEMYHTRQEWKAQGNSAERALKLALNSLYGKMAQRTGWKAEEPDKLPTWHQLEWAGFITSAARAKLWSVLHQYAEHIIAVETDAVFSTVPLPLETGDSLGQWSEETFEWITYVQNGLYFAGLADGKVLERYRGFDRGSLDHEQVLRYFEQVGTNPKSAILSGRTTRFIGLGLGLHTKATWRSWLTDDKMIRVGGGKRSHIQGLCQACKQGVSLADGLHDLSITTPGGRSHPHSLPWLASIESQLRLEDELTMW